MKRLYVGIVAVGIACGDSSGPGKRAASITGIAGDNQTGTFGAQLAFPLSFTALGSDGLPAQGVSVTWSATPAGAATFTPATSTTDANGVASTNVRLGTVAGQITIQATVPGVSPIVYHATALDPCLSATTFNVGQSVDATLATSDCNLNGAGWLYDFYALTLPAGQQSLRISMHGSFDTWIDLFDPQGNLFAFDDDSILGVQQNSQLDIILPGNSTYTIGANSFSRGATGTYTLASAVRPAEMNGCREVWVARGVSVSDSITNNDCADSSATPRRYDVARIIAFDGTVLTITQRSTAINPSLALYQANFGQAFTRTLVASNDDSLAGTNDDAFIQHSVQTSAVFDVIIGASAAGETGAYTFEVSASTTLSPRMSEPVSRGRDTWWRDVLLPRRSKL